MDRDNYKLVKSYIIERRHNLNTLVDIFDRELRNQRDVDQVPIYSVKGRVKSPKSAFLKLIRYDGINSTGHVSVSDLPDILGLRVYCLAESHIDRVHPCLLDVITNKFGFQLTGINIYSNFNKSRMKEFLRHFEDRKDSILPNNYVNTDGKELREYIYQGSDNETNKFKIKYEIRHNGYSSIHYLFKVNNPNTLFKKYDKPTHDGPNIAKLQNVQCEIQLRTVLQDVWAEIEHNIIYKSNNSHPHLPKLFNSFAETLINANNQIEMIVDISDKDRTWSNYSKNHVNFNFLLYDESMDMGSVFSTTEAQKLYNDYLDAASKVRDADPDDRQNKLYQCRKLLEKLKDMSDYDGNVTAQYFFDMELAFTYMYDGNYDDAYPIYRQYTRNDSDDDATDEMTKAERYAAYFRIGEIEYFKSRYHHAIVNYDQCERLMVSIDCNPVNKFNVYMRLANMYWNLGTKYIHQTVDKIKIAESIYVDNSDDILNYAPSAQLSLYNNYCWYKLDEMYCTSADNNNEKKIKCYMEAEKYYEKLESKISELKQNEVWSNWYDTLAWFNYTSAVIKPEIDQIKEEDINNHFEKAKKYCDLLMNTHLLNKSVNVIKSLDCHRNHIREIMTAYEKYKSTST